MTSSGKHIYLTHKIRLEPTNVQKTYFKKACGVSRFAWNWGLATWNTKYSEKAALLAANNTEEAAKISISGFTLKKEFNSIKRLEFPWTMEVTKYACQQPFIQLQSAWNNYFSGRKNMSRPNFKKKGKCTDSFYIGGEVIKIVGKSIKLPKLGFVKMSEELRFNSKINSVTISRTADNWFAAIQVAISENDLHLTHKKCSGTKKVGIDLGIKKVMVLSDGTAIDAPKPLKLNLRKLAREQRKLSRKIRVAKQENRKLATSKNIQKQKVKVQKLHSHISNIRKDAIHKITTYITTNFRDISIEDLNTSGMLKNHKLSRAISDIGFSEIRRQLTYKSELRNNKLHVVDRFFPSSKLCSNCGRKKTKEELTLATRTYNCICGLTLDRDLNAAINLVNEVRLRKIRPVRSELKPVEIMAMQRAVYPISVTSILEAGISQQTA